MESEGKVQTTIDLRLHRRACLECSRRKQSCNRKWPCSNCRKRRLPDRCQYVQPNPTPQSNNSLRERNLDTEDELDGDEIPVEDVNGDEAALKAMGYMPSSFGCSLSKPVELMPGSSASYAVGQADVLRAMESLPPLPLLETLVSSFIKRTNFYYYVIYPPRLIEVYSIWREDVRLAKPLDPVVTCLVLRVCACAAHDLSTNAQEKSQAEVNMPITDLYNKAAIELSGKIPAGRGGLLHVQQLVLTSCWNMSEAHFVDCWHALAAAVREAQEIGLNRECKADGLSDFDREMRRRTWCILDTWDWQMSTLFTRPSLIDRRDCDIISPNVDLEGTPSPMYQMKLQYEVTQTIYRKFGSMGQSTANADAVEFWDLLEKWTESFPPMLRIVDPDTSMDDENPWITLHRRYLHAMTYAMRLWPLKSYLCRTYDQTELRELQSMRASGVDCCLKLRDAHIDLFHSIQPICVKYNLTQVSLVDLALVLSSAIIHDEHRNLPKRDDVIEVIADVLKMLRPAHNVANTGSTPYRILSNLVRRLLVSQDEIQILQRRLATVKFDLGPQPATTPTGKSPQAIGVQRTNAAQDRPGTPILIIDSTDSDVLTDTVITDAQLNPCNSILPLEDSGERPLGLQSERGQPLSAVNSALSNPSSTNSHTAMAMDQRSLPLPILGHYPQLTSLLQPSTKPVLDVFLERFLDWYGSEMPSACLPLYWIHVGRPYQIWRIGAAARAFSPLLCDSFGAVSSAHFGLFVGDWRLVSAGDRIYSSTLRSLQTAICHPTQSKSDEVLMAVALCGVYEGMRRTNERAFITHTFGVLKLLEYRGVQAQTSGIGHWLFVELRSYLVFAAITTRSPTFLALPEWKSVPWSTGSTSKDLLQYLLDQMVDIPTLLRQADRIRSYSGAESPANLLRWQRELCTLAAAIEQGLHQWRRDWADQYPGGQARELPVQAGDTVPTFRCRDPTTGGVVHAATLTYPDPVLAQALCHYYSALILVLTVDARPRDPELNYSIYELACLICRTMGYYVRTVPGCLASRVAFPFRVAYDSLPEGGIERAYVEEVFRLIGKRRSSKEWECALEGVSVPK